jgi:hypothetical protein
MFRVWNALFLFLPLHRVTIYELLGQLKPEDKNLSWPMWPFRLWQIEICYIYLGAGFGKLSSERWQDGEAMYHVSTKASLRIDGTKSHRSCRVLFHGVQNDRFSSYQVIHITDFFGGAFTPEIIYNRLGPLQILTYSSVALECLCSFLIWPLETRMITFWSIMGLHIGIELAMNMHCFEWLAMLGWLFFLVEPAREMPYKPSTLLSIVLTAGLIVAAFDTLPFDEFIFVTPRVMQRPMEQAMEVKEVLRTTFITPYLAPIGLQQHVWNMFCAAPDEVYVYEGAVTLMNGTKTTWARPAWDDLDWLQKKRWQRPMSYYDSVADGYASPVMESVVRGMALDYGIENVASIVLTVHTDVPPEHPPAHLGFWDVAKQPRERKRSKILFTLNLCDDLDARCEDWAEQGLCEDRDNWILMMNRCKSSCDFCFDTSDIRLNQRVAVIWPVDSQYYTATVLEIQNGRRYRLDFDDYEFEYERYEWLDRVDMRERKFKILNQDEDPEMTAPTPYRKEDAKRRTADDLTTPPKAVIPPNQNDVFERPIKLDVRVEHRMTLPLEPRHLQPIVREKAVKEEL